MKWIFILIFLASCMDQDYTLSKMKSPVIIIGISDEINGASFSARDSLGMIETFSNSGLATTIAKSRHIGDTIK